MILRTCAEFETDIPDDTVEDEHDIIEFGGRNVAEALIELLRRQGPAWKISSPDYEGEQGWTFTVKTGKRTLYFQVQRIEKAVLVTDDVTFLGGGDKRVLAEVLEQLNRDLRNDPRFHEIKWCRGEELFDNGPGASSPTGG